MGRTRTSTPSFVMDHIDELKAERMRLGYTRPTLSTQTGVSVSMLEQYERGTCLPKETNYNKLAVVLGWEEWE